MSLRVNLIWAEAGQVWLRAEFPLPQQGSIDAINLI
jgi:hypothetical protein